MAMDTWNHLIQLKAKLIKPRSIITYVYKEVKEDPTKPKEGDVIITYVDENGKRNSKTSSRHTKTHHMTHHITQLRKVKT